MFKFNYQTPVQTPVEAGCVLRWVTISFEASGQARVCGHCVDQDGNKIEGSDFEESHTISADLLAALANELLPAMAEAPGEVAVVEVAPVEAPAEVAPAEQA